MTAPALCPICKREIPANAAFPRPFCSARCRAIDLGGWLEGRYRIGAAGDDDEDDPAPGPEPEPEDGKTDS